MSGKPAGPGRAPVRPNACRIRGKVLEIHPEPDNAGAVWDVALSEAQDVPGSPNFAANLVGRTIHLYVHPDLAEPVSAGDHVSATVSYRGDERGGRFAVVEDGAHRE
jgi:hypothetical protein